jgi:hypothetical protein
MSAPSDRRCCGPVATVVTARTVAFCDVQNWSRTARRLPRFRTPSTVLERNAAIWRRETFAVGSKVVGVVPVIRGEDFQHQAEGVDARGAAGTDESARGAGGDRRVERRG